MKNYLQLLFVCFLMCLFTTHVMAESEVQNVERISEINHSNPLQNPSYDRSGKVLSRRVLDRKNKVVGHIEDVIIKSNGHIQFLNVELDRLKLGSVYLNYKQMVIKSTSNAYSLAIKDREIKNLYPSLLAEMETAAGNRNELISVKNIIGASIRTENGRMIGVVNEILFSEKASRVKALYVTLKTGVLRGKHIAIPFGSSFSFNNTGQRKNIIIDNDMAKSVLQYAKENK